MKLKRRRLFTLVLAVVCLISMVFPSALFAEEPGSEAQGAVNASLADPAQDEILKSLSFFVGKVERSYNDTASSVETPVDLSQYIDTANKTIESVTGELDWDYDKGIMKIDTAKTQGAVGFLNKEASIDLGDVIISSNNEYATVMVSSLDENPIGTSGKVMIQAMTEDKYYGAVTEDTIRDNEIVKEIKNLGSAPLNVKDIDVTVTLKNRAAGSKIVTLDENGYPKAELTGIAVGADLQITLAADAVYTVVTDSAVNMVSPYPTGDNANYVWWEGENPTETNYPDHSHFDTTTEGKWNLLSGGNWLTSDNDNVPAGTELYAKYAVEVPADGEYNFWIRKFWQHGPFRWHFDDSEDWRVAENVSLADSVEFRTNICANWVNLGKINLTAGTHTFEFKLLTGEGYNTVSGVDCFILTPDAFVPRGYLKPGEKTGLAEDGYWNFEPAGDPFADSALMDLRSLNEAVAGQSGNVRRDGDKFVLGDGTPVKFWAVNATADQDQKTIDYMASRLAKFGVNMVRVHGGIFDGDSADLSTINQGKLDKLHYMVSAMKKEGIYTNISMYFPLWINVKPEYGLEGYDTINNKIPFALLQFDPEFQEIYKNWARAIYNTVNPYTGISLAEDPAVAIIEVQNEDNYFFWTFGRGNIPEVQMNKLETLFGTWLATKYGTLDAALTAWGEGSGQPLDNIAEGRMELKDAWFMTAAGAGTGAFRERMSDQVQFLTENQKKFYEDMVNFYRNEIGTQSMISASNWTTADSKTLDALERYTYTATDVIDRHGYYECSHEGDDGTAGYSVRVGHTYKDMSVMNAPQSSITPVIQTENYPHMITETAWTNPSKYHGESVPMWATYGALQGMDAIHLFAVGTADWEASPAKWPVMVPSVLGQFPAFALMYRRGDVQEAQTVLKVNHSMADLYDFQGSPVYENQALDLIRMPAEPGPEPAVVPGEDLTLYNFETSDLHGFTNKSDTGTATITKDVFRKYGGESSMKVAFNGEVHIGLQGVDDIPAGSTVRFRMYIPSAVNADIAAVVADNNSDPYNQAYKPAVYVEKDNWFELEVPFEGEGPAAFVGVKILSPDEGVTIPSGEIWIDSITYDGYEDTLVQPPVVEGPDESLFNFENGDLQGFQKTGGTGAAQIEIDTFKKYCGESSVKVSFNGPVQVGINTPFDIPTGSILKIRFYVPSSTVTVLQGMLFGNTWTGGQKGFYKAPAEYQKDQWIEFEIPYDFVSPSVGLLINLTPSQDAPEGVVWIDSITYEGYEPPVVVEPPAVEGPDTALYNFEDGQLHGFAQVAGPGTATITNDTARKYCGNGSAKVEFNGGSVQLGIQKDITDIPAGSTVRFRMYVPSGVNIDLQPVVFGAGWAYNGDYRENKWIGKDSWIEMSVPFTNGGLPIVKVGLNINVPAVGGTPEGTIWIDSITFEDTAAPVITLDQTGGTVDAADFTVSGSVNEACTVKVNGTEVTLDGELAFSTVITLVEGINNITVEAADAAGNTSSESIEVVYAGLPTVNLTFDKEIIRAGRVAYVTIGVNNAASLKGFDLTLGYDTALFDLVDIAAHTDFGVQGETAYIDSNISGGSIHVLGVQLGSGAVEGDAGLITLTFNAKQAVNGIGDFNISDGAEISDSNADLFVLGGFETSLIVADPDTVKDDNNAVKINDLTAVAGCFMKKLADDDGYVLKYDMNKDGIIDLLDIVYVATNILNDPLN